MILILRPLGPWLTAIRTRAIPGQLAVFFSADTCVVWNKQGGLILPVSAGDNAVFYFSQPHNRVSGGA
jgi:hypothetical protein